MSNDITAGEIMTRKLFKVMPANDLNFIEVLSEVAHIRHIPVVDHEDRIQGVISVRNIMEHLAKPNASHFAPASSIMTRNAVIASPQTGLRDIAKLMLEHKVSSIMIVEDETLVGIVTEHDFVKQFAKS